MSERHHPRGHAKKKKSNAWLWRWLGVSFSKRNYHHEKGNIPVYLASLPTPDTVALRVATTFTALTNKPPLFIPKLGKRGCDNWGMCGQGVWINIPNLGT
jgi:hypothetical protein